MADTPWDSIDPFAGGLTKDMEFIVKIGNANYRIPLENITLSSVDTSDAKKNLPLNSTAVYNAFEFRKTEYAGSFADAANLAEIYNKYAMQNQKLYTGFLDWGDPRNPKRKTFLIIAGDWLMTALSDDGTYIYSNGGFHRSHHTENKTSLMTFSHPNIEEYNEFIVTDTSGVININAIFRTNGLIYPYEEIISSDPSLSPSTVINFSLGGAANGAESKSYIAFVGPASHPGIHTRTLLQEGAYTLSVSYALS